MSAKLYYSPFIPAFTANGAPAPGAQLLFYLTGTTTKAAVYADAALSIPLSNPVLADGSGKFPPIYINDAVAYRVRTLDANGVQIGTDVDPYYPATAVTIAAKGDMGPAGPQGVPGGATDAAVIASLQAQLALLLPVLGLPTIKGILNGGMKGLWVDTTDMTKIFQDNAGATPGAVNSTVGLWKDFSNAANNFVQATAGQRPILKSISGVTSVEFDVTDDWLVMPSLDMTGTTTATFVVAFIQYSLTSTTYVARFGSSSPAAAPGAFGVLTNNTTPGTMGVGLGNGANYRFANDGFRQDVPITRIAIIEAKPGQTPNLTVTVNGKVHNISDVATAGTIPQMLNQTNNLQLGNAGAGDKIGIIAAGYFGGLLTDAQKQIINAYAASISGVSLVDPAFIDQPATFDNSAVAIDRASHIETSPFASVSYTTSAVTVRINSWNNIQGTYPLFTEIGVYVNGVWNQSVTLGASPVGFLSTVITLPAGSKTVTFVNGLQSNPAGTLLGSFLVSIEADNTLTRLATATANRIVLLGDSITVGANAATPAQNGYGMRLRTAAAVPVAIEGYGAASLFSLAGDGTKRTAIVARLTTLNPVKLWIALGTNDYGLNTTTAAAFGTSYGLLLDAIHTALPSCQIWAQTPIVRVTETANGSGNTLGDYRAAMTTACSGRSYVTLVNGTTILSTSDLDGADGLHPTTAGHGTYAVFVKAALGA